jgi:hemolysin activation/secretion protein
VRGFSLRAISKIDSRCIALWTLVWRRVPLLLAGAIVTCLLPPPAEAQVVERNLPPPIQTPSQTNTLEAPSVQTADDDDRSLGVEIKSIVVLDADAALVISGPDRGVDLSRTPRLNTTHGRAALSSFIGRPLSRKRLSELRAAVAAELRRVGYPVVSVIAPEQDVTSGLVQLRLIEFRLGKVVVKSNASADPANLTAAIRTQHGDLIEAAQLSEDLDGLNAFPFRTVSAALSKGDAPLETDLILAVENRTPLVVSAGYANSGPRSGKEGRYYLAVVAGGLPLRDLVVSYQLTGSPDFWLKAGRRLEATHPEYVSHGLRLSAPITPRQYVDATVNYVETNSSGDLFGSRLYTLEATIGYRGALSDWPVSFGPHHLLGEASFGVEGKEQRRIILFGGEPVLVNLVQVYQAYFGWSGFVDDPWGRSRVSVHARMSPGGINDRNTDEAFRLYSQDRLNASDYAYVTLTLARATRLPWGLTLYDQVYLQASGQPLPDTELIPVGGANAVRGYRLDDGAFDSAVTLRNDIRLQPFRLKAPGGAVLTGSGFAFADFGYAQSCNLRQVARPASVGAGVDVSLTERAVFGVNLGFALHNLGMTKANDLRLDAHIQASF